MGLQLTELMKTQHLWRVMMSLVRALQKKQCLFIWLFVCLFSVEFSTTSAFLFFAFYFTAFYSWQCSGVCPPLIVLHLLQFA